MSIYKPKPKKVTLPPPDPSVRPFRTSMAKVGDTTIKDIATATGNTKLPVNKIPSTNYTGNNKKSGDGLEQAAGVLLPLMSNIRNAFTKAPKPAVSNRVNPVILPSVKFNNDRQAVYNTTEAGMRGAAASLDENTAAAVNAGLVGQRAGMISSVNEKEALTNADIAARRAQMNSQVDYINAAKMDSYQDQIIQSVMANQMNQAANMSNAADKITVMGNQRRAEQLEGDKIKVLSRMYDPGVWERLKKFTDDNNIVMPQKYGGMLKKLALGGELNPPVNRNTGADQDMNLRDSVMAIIGNGYTDLSSEDAKGHKAMLDTILGANSNKFFTNMMVYNNTSKGTPEQRLEGYFNTVHTDPEVASTVKRLKNLGYGIPAGFQSSVNTSNMKLTGRANLVKLNP